MIATSKFEEDYADVVEVRRGNDPLDVDFSCATFEIVRDVLSQDDGGFRPGSRFKKDHMRRMLMDKSIDPRAMVRNLRTGEVKQVVQFKLTTPDRNYDKKKIADEEIPKMQALFRSGFTQARIARMYGISSAQTSRIINGKRGASCISN